MQRAVPVPSLEFLGRVCNEGLPQAVVSFPGIEEELWKVVTQEYTELSCTCVFFPNVDANGQPHPLFGKHATPCRCTELYGFVTEWGCQWYLRWVTNTQEAVHLNKSLIAVYKAGLKGDDKQGLGNSQKGEVAYVRRELPQAAIQSMDVNEFIDFLAEVHAKRRSDALHLDDDRLRQERRVMKARLAALRPSLDLSGALRCFALGEHKAAIAGLGIGSVAALLRANDDEVEAVHELLEDQGAERQARRDFRRWLTELRAAQTDAPLPCSESRHFYGLSERLNDRDTSGVDATIILRVDIDPYSRDGSNMPKASMRMAQGAVERQVRAALSAPVPVVSVVGPTGVGKSFLVSSFLERDQAAGSWPLVAEPGATVPTSAHVSLYRGAAQLSDLQREPLLLFDLEGEDGRTPKSLEENYLRRMAAFVSLGFTEDALRTQLQPTIKQRCHIVKEVLPPLAYLISDVILFIDQVELRRTERVDRVRHFAEQAHLAMQTVAWRPALVIIQNKWARGPTEAPRYDVTEEYDWMVNDLDQVFCHVAVLRLPLASDRHVFEDSLLALHRAVHTAAQRVQATRRSNGSLYAESEFWIGLETLVNQLNERGVGEAVQIDSLSEALTQRLVYDASGNAVTAMRCLGEIPVDAATFQERAHQVLKWYAYHLAGQARFQGDAQSTRAGLRDIYDRVMECLSAEEPCGAVLEHDDGKKYPCTQRRTGHQAWHRHPSLMPVRSKQFMKRVLLWKDWVPCHWDGAFMAIQGATFESFEEDFDKYTADVMPAEQFEVAFAESSTAQRLAQHHRRESSEGLCLLCLRPSDDLTLLPNPACHHYLCRHCILVREKLSRLQGEVVCPLCACRSALPSRPEIGRLRVLTLDGGGVRGLVEIHVLQRLEERFAPLPVQSLFDLIVGTSAGGLISMALLARKPLARLRTLVETLARDFLDVSTPVRGLRMLMGWPSCDSGGFLNALVELFGKDRLEGHQHSLPWCCCTTYNDTLGVTQCIGNLPGDLSSRFPHICAGMPLHTAAMASAAAPTFFAPVSHVARAHEYDAAGASFLRTTQWSLVDGGIEANCPAKQAATIVEELRASRSASRDAGMEMLVSIGTGRQPSSPNASLDNGYHWGAKLIDLATDAERQWASASQENLTLREVLKLRVNPPDLGAEPAFSSGSIPNIHRGMDAYFAGAEGGDAMEELFAATFAKLWQVEGLFTFVAGAAPAELVIALRDLRFKVEDLEDPDLRQLVRARRALSPAALEGMGRAELVDVARQAFEQQPFSPPLPGRFAVIFDGQENVLEEGGRTFTLARSEKGYPALNVVWRTERFGDFPINGFPRLVNFEDGGH